MFSSTVRLLPGYILVLLLAGTSAVQAQGNENSVPLTLNYHEAEGHVPEGTKVVVWDEQENAQTLSTWGDRATMEDSLTTRASQSFERVYDGVDGEARTRSIRIAADGNTAAYVLARVPDDIEEGFTFYESRREDQAGLDVVETGNMEMIPVEGDNVAWAQDVFEAITSEEFVSTTLRLTGEAADGVADIRIWNKEGGTFESLDDRASIVENDHISSSVKNGTTDEQFERTAYSSKVVYVLGWATNAEGEPVLYESVWNGNAGFGPVTDGTITMKQVPEDDQATMATVFLEDSGWVGVWLMMRWLIGGVILVALIFMLLKWVKRPKNRESHATRKKPGVIKQFQRATRKLGNLLSSEGKQQTDSARKANQREHPEKNLDEKEDLYTGSQSQEIVASNQQKDAQKTEIIDDLRDEVEELKEKVRRRDEEIRRLRDKENDASHSEETKSQSTSTQRVQQRKSVADKISDVYVEWCQSQGPAMLDKYFAFESLLNDNITHAEFSRIYRDHDSTETLFGEKGSVKDPVEYWLIVAEGRRFLLPQPSRNRFKELGDSFIGSNISPSNVSKAHPAEIESRGNRFVLSKKGRIE